MPPLMHECSADGGGQAMVLEEEEGRSGGGGGPEVETNRTPANRCKAIHAGVRPMARLEHRRPATRNYFLELTPTVNMLPNLDRPLTGTTRPVRPPLGQARPSTAGTARRPSPSPTRPRSAAMLRSHLARRPSPSPARPRLNQRGVQLEEESAWPPRPRGAGRQSEPATASPEPQRLSTRRPSVPRKVALQQGRARVDKGEEDKRSLGQDMAELLQTSGAVLLGLSESREGWVSARKRTKDVEERLSSMTAKWKVVAAQGRHQSLGAIADQKEISEKEISELKLRSAFDKLTHGSGHLSTVDIQEAIRSVYDKPAIIKMDEVMRYADGNSDHRTFCFEGFRKVVAQELALQSTNAAARLGASEGSEGTSLSKLHRFGQYRTLQASRASPAETPPSPNPIESVPPPPPPSVSDNGRQPSSSTLSAIASPVARPAYATALTPLPLSQTAAMAMQWHSAPPLAAAYLAKANKRLGIAAAPMKPTAASAARAAEVAEKKKLHGRSIAASCGV